MSTPEVQEALTLTEAFAAYPDESRSLGEDTAVALAAEVRRLQKRESELVEALRPFSYVYTLFPEYTHHVTALSILETTNSTNPDITFLDLYRAYKLTKPAADV